MHKKIIHLSAWALAAFVIMALIAASLVPMALP